MLRVLHGVSFSVYAVFRLRGVSDRGHVRLEDGLIGCCWNVILSVRSFSDGFIRTCPSSVAE